MRRLCYSEKLVEETIKFFPKELLGKDLTLLMQQPIFDSFRPDLIFKDNSNTIYIVEVQIGQLDKNHIYRCLEYRDLFLNNTKSKQAVKLISFANSIPKKYSIILNAHSIEGIAIEKKELRKTIEKLRHNIKVAKSKKELEKENSLSTYDILTGISKSKLNNRNSLEVNGLVFYQFPFKKRYDDYYGHMYFNLKSLKEYSPRYFREYDSHNDIKPEVPIEIIVSKKILTIDWDEIRMIESWILNLNKYSIFDKYSQHEVIFGHRYQSDYLDYEEYIKDRIKTFQPLWMRYRTENGYDIDKIKKDLQLINSITFTSGKFSNYKTDSLFEKIEITEDAGSLEKNWEKNLNRAKYWNKKEDIDTIKEEYEYYRKLYKWVAVSFINLNSHILNLFDELIWHILAGHIEHKNEQITINLHSNCHICPIAPKDISQVKVHLLNKTSKYFINIR